jgi:AcrR family transcriptional regulator
MAEDGATDAADQIDGRSLRARALKHKTRNQLLAAARRVFGGKGFHGASISDLLAEADVARGTFYAHFDSKREAFAAVLQVFLEMLAGAIEPVQVNGPATVTEQLVGNFTRVLTLLETNEDLTRMLLHQAADAGPEVEETVAGFYRGALAMIVRSITAGTRMGLVREGDIQLRAIFVLGAIREAVSQTLLGDAELRPREEVAQQLLTFALHGLLNEGDSTR